MTKEPSQRTIFLWNILGSLSTGLIAFLLLFGVSRFLSVRDGDVYSYAYALGNLFSIIALFQVRNYQATDIAQQYSFNDYLAARFWTCLLMLLSTGIYLVFSHLSHYENFIIFLVCLYRLTDAVSDVFQGLFQQQERMDWAGKSLFIRNSLMVLTFLLTLMLTKDLITALIVLVLVSVASIVCFDVKTAKPLFSFQWQNFFSTRVLSLLKQCLPLFIIGFILVNIYNQPKYSLNKFYDLGLVADGAQKDFNILFMPVFVMSLLILILRPMITQLAINLEEKRFTAFMQLQKRLFLSLAGIGLFVIIGGYVLALPILELIYATPLQQYRTAFLLLLCGGVLSSFATLFDNLLTILRRQGLLVWSFSVAWLISLLTSDLLVKYYGLTGAALSFLVSMSVWLLALFITYLLIFRRIKHDFY